MSNIIKRDGRKMPFDEAKIEKAVMSAFVDVDGKGTPEAAAIGFEIAKYVKDLNTELTVEQIQDIVEDRLMDSRKDVAKAYIKYRADRTRDRERNSAFMKGVISRIKADNVQNSNANMDEKSFGGRMGEAKNDLLKKIALDEIMSDTMRNGHLNNERYVHDLDSYAVGMHNCLSIPFDKLLANGFTTRNMDIRPANRLSTALQLVAVIMQLQSLMQFGGVSATHLDHTMVPYVRKSFYAHFMDGLEFLEPDAEFQSFTKKAAAEHSIECDEYKAHPSAYAYALKMTVREAHQSVEALFHNLNTLQSRSGGQLPFSSINFGTCTLPEGRMIIKEILEVSIEGLGKLHKTSIFPCSIFQMKKGINRKPGDPNYDLYRLALKSTAKRLYPNYANCDWTGNEGYDENDPKTYFSTMGCRTANGFDINGFGQMKDGRGNICPMTIIMPTLAMEADGDVEDFMALLDANIDLTIKSLIERFEYIASQSLDSARFMWDNGTMEGYVPEEGIRSALKHGTLAVGQIGLAETLQILIGKDHTTKEGMELAKRIEELFKIRCAEAKEKYRLNFGVYYTPAESLCHTALKKFRDKYGVIPNVSDKEFFTNSVHVPVWHEMSPFEKIDIESQLTGYSSAGSITYVEFDSSVQNNLDALESVVNYAMDKDIPYFAVNVPNDTCLDCGYTEDMNDVCPMCGGSHIQRLRRVTGYLTSDYKTAFNLGKQDEVRLRYKHSRTKDQRFG